MEKFSYAYNLNHFEYDESLKKVLKLFWKNYDKYEEKIKLFGEYVSKDPYEIAEYIDRISRPILRYYSPIGERIDYVWVNPYLKLVLEKINEFEINSRTILDNELFYHYALGYLLADAGIYCIITLTHQTGIILYKYSNLEIYKNLLGIEKPYYYGGTWLTEIKSGSDLSMNETIAINKNDYWILNGIKYYTSNVGIADYALVSAKYDESKGIRGLALFLVPKYNKNGELNYKILRLKEKSATNSVPTGEVELNNSEAYLIGDLENGIYYIMEMLMYSRLDNAMGAMGLALKSYIEAKEFSKRRKIFGDYLINFPLIKRDLEEIKENLLRGLIISFKAISEFNKVFNEKPKFSQYYNYARFLTHIAKNRTAELSIKITLLAREIFGGFGFLLESPIERLHREALVTPVWEGSSNVQALDMIEVLFKKNIFDIFLKDFEKIANQNELDDVENYFKNYLKLNDYEKQYYSKELLNKFAHFIENAYLKHLL
ncbi:MAG: acyl-CoA dehydrogenase family protein [candidate division WOR-3 bacterium]